MQLIGEMHTGPVPDMLYRNGPQQDHCVCIEPREVSRTSRCLRVFQIFFFFNLFATYRLQVFVECVGA